MEKPENDFTRKSCPDFHTCGKRRKKIITNFRQKHQQPQLNIVLNSNYLQDFVWKSTKVAFGSKRQKEKPTTAKIVKYEKNKGKLVKVILI